MPDPANTADLEKHLDYKCKHFWKGERQVQGNFISLSDPELEALMITMIYTMD